MFLNTLILIILFSFINILRLVRVSICAFERKNNLCSFYGLIDKQIISKPTICTALQVGGVSVKAKKKKKDVNILISSRNTFIFGIAVDAFEMTYIEMVLY